MTEHLSQEEHEILIESMKRLTQFFKEQYDNTK